MNAGPRLPLSPAQQSLWLAAQLAPEPATYHVPWLLRLSGDLDVPALRRAIETLADRHDVLRARLGLSGAEAYQVMGVEKVALRLSDVPRDKVVATLEEEVRTPFDLDRGPMLRACLLRLGPREHILAVVMHHIAVDGWSIGVLGRELSALYCGQSLPPPVRFADAVLGTAPPGLEKEAAYWRQRLRGATPLTLPADFPGPASPGGPGLAVTVALPGIRERLRTLSRELRTTPYPFLLAVFMVLMARHSGQDDILIGGVTSGRDRSGLRSVVGYLVNTIVLRADLTGDPSFIELVLRMRQETLAAQENDRLPWQRIAEPAGTGPLFRVMFDLAPAVAPVSLPGLRVTPVEAETGAAKFDLSFTIVDGDPVTCRIEYATGLFRQSTVERLGHEYRCLAEHALDAPHTPVSRLEPVPAAQRRRLLRSGRGETLPRRDGPLPSELFLRRATAAPEATAVVDGTDRVSYRTLGRDALALARRLAARGVGPEDVVGIALPRGIPAVTAVLGTWLAGAAYLPIDPAEPPPEAQSLCSVVIGPDWLPGTSDAEPRRPHPDNLAYIIPTSGSTGRPKAVMVSHRNAAGLVAAWDREYGLGRTAGSVLQMAGFTFDVFTADLLRALTSGGKLVICPREVMLDPVRLNEIAVAEQVTCADFVPAALRLFTERYPDGPAWPSLRLLVVGSDVWSRSEYARTRHGLAPGVRLVNAYGLTESTIDGSVYESSGDPGAWPDRPVPIGRPLPGARLHVLDRWLRPVPAGVEGQLYAGGFGVARGYAGQAGLTAHRFVPDPFPDRPGQRLYATGDLACVRPDGVIEFRGRADRQVKIRGVRVEPGAVENVLRRHPDVGQAAVVAAEGRLIAYVTGPVDPARLRAFAAGHLPTHLVPAIVIPLAALPLTPSGKLDSGALPPPGSARPDPAVVPPRTGTEQRVAAIWRESLGGATAAFGVHDDFFGLGGDSLTAARTVLRLREGFGVPLPLYSILEHRTVAGVAAALDRLRDTRPRTRPSSAAATRPILVTGGTGATGSFIVSRLLDSGYAVRLLCRAESAALADEARVEIALGDLADPGSLAAAARGTAGIVHAACTFTEPGVDIAATAALVRASSGRPFVFISSTDVYGRPCGRIGEEHPVDPSRSGYAAAKIACEAMLRDHPRAAVLRAPLIWGPHPGFGRQLAFGALGELYRTVSRDEPVILPADETLWPDAFIDARDLARLTEIRLSESGLAPTASLNAVGGCFLWPDLARELARLTGSASAVRCEAGARPGYVPGWVPSGERLRRTGFRPEYGWRDSLAAVVSTLELSPSGKD